MRKSVGPCKRAVLFMRHLTGWMRPAVRGPRTGPEGGEEGNAIVELAIVLPIFALLLLGIAEWGLFFAQYIELVDAEEQGAQYLATYLSSNQTDPCADTLTQIQNAAPMLDPSKITVKFLFNPTDSIGAITSNSCPGDQTHLVVGEDASLTVSYPVTVNIMGVNYLSLSSVSASNSVLVTTTN